MQHQARNPWHRSTAVGYLRRQVDVVQRRQPLSGKERRERGHIRSAGRCLHRIVTALQRLCDRAVGGQLTAGRIHLQFYLPRCA